MPTPLIPARARLPLLIGLAAALAGQRPAGAHDGPDGQVSHKHKTVRSQPSANVEWHDAALGEPLYKQGRVNTFEDSTAAVTFRDDSTVALRANTLLIVYGHHALRDKEVVAMGAELERGVLRARLGELEGGRQAVLATPGANTDLEGGNSLLKVDEQGTSRIHNHGDGQTTVRAKRGGKTKLARGMGVKVETDKQAARPIPLPPTPSWQAGSQRFLIVPGQRSELRGSWTPIAEASRYFVEVAEDAEGVAVLSAVEVPATTQGFEVHGLPAGSYHVRVASVDADQFESIPSDDFAVELLAVDLEGPGEVGPRWPDDGGLSPTPQVLPGARLTLPAGVRCKDASDQFVDRPLLLAPGVHEPQCEDEQGRPVASFPIAVADLGAGFGGGAGDLAEAVEIVRGQASTHTLTIASELPLPRDLHVVAPAGIAVQAVEPGDGPGQWRVTLLAGPDAPAEVALGLSFVDPAVTAGTDLDPTFSTVAVAIVDPPPVDAAPEAPERHMFEFGLAGGVMVIAPDHGLYRPADAEHHPLRRPAGELVLRAGYYPLRWTGIEVAGRVAPAQTDQGEPALVWSLRAALVGQLPYRITPFILVGGEILGVSSGPAALGHDSDFGVVLGGGVKFYVHKRVALRLGASGMFHEALGDGRTTHAEADLGLSVVLGRRSPGRRP